MIKNLTVKFLTSRLCNLMTQQIQHSLDKREEHYSCRIQSHSSKYKEFHSPSVKLLLNLIHTYDLIRAQVVKHIEKYDLSPAAFNVLMILSHYGQDGCPMCEIGELLLVSRPNVTGLIDSLTRKGLVERTEKEGDRRIKLVRLTPKARKLLDSILPSHYINVRKMFACISDEEKEILVELLTKIRHGIAHLLDREKSLEG